MNIHAVGISTPLAQELSQVSADSLAVWVHISSGSEMGAIDTERLGSVLGFDPKRVREALGVLYEFGMVDCKEGTGEWLIVGANEVHELDFSIETAGYVFNKIQTVH